jgi:uncharacterized protein YqeY
MMTIHEILRAGIAPAMKARDEVRLRTLRSLVSAMTNEVVAKKRKPDEFLTDDEALAVLKRASNQRKDSIEQFEKGGRVDLTGPEKEELAIIDTFLPAQMSQSEIEIVIKAKIIELQADKSKVGMLTGAVMKELKGKADGGVVKEIINRLLQ